MASEREYYRPSGRVAWIGLALGFVLSLPLTILSAYALSAAFRNDIYVILLAPFISTLPAMAAVWMALWLGHCRNSWVGMLVGLVTGLAVLVGMYLFDFEREVGFNQLNRFDGYVSERQRTDIIGGHGIRRRAPKADPPTSGDLPYLLLDAATILLMPTVAGWVRSRRPYNEERRAWLYAHKVTISRDSAYAIRGALEHWDLEALVDAASPSVFDPLRGYGELTLYYIPYDPATPVYLWVTLTAGLLSWRHGTRIFIKAILLSPEEAAALVGRLKPPGAKIAAVLDVEPVGAAPMRADAIARVEELPADQVAGVMRGKRYMMLVALNLAPLVLGLLVILALSTVLVLYWSRLDIDERGAFGFAILVVLVGTLAFCVRYADELPIRLRRKWCLEAIRQRPEALFSPDDPDARYVEVVPRKNWGRVMFDNAADLGFLKVDVKRRLLLYEGDSQRWSIPAEAVVSCEMEEFIVGVPEPNERNLFALAVLKANVNGERWEAPLLPARTTGQRPLGSVRRRWARELLDAIRYGLIVGEA
jgi:hypothetical protein